MGAGGDERLAQEGGEPAGAPLPHLAEDRPQHGPGPEPSTQNGEDEAGIGAERRHLALEGRPVAGGRRLEAHAVGRARTGQHQGRTVRPQHAGGHVGLGEGQPAGFEFLAERGIGGRRHEQHEGGGHHVVQETGSRRGLGADATADPVVALHQQHPSPLEAEHGGADEAVDAASHDDVIGLGHSGTSPQVRRHRRSGLWECKFRRLAARLDSGASPGPVWRKPMRMG